MLLCEVALGKSKELRHAQYIEDLPNKEFQSVKGVGSNAPGYQKTLTFPEGFKIPLGKYERND